jgi:hypothetical protein
MTGDSCSSVVRGTDGYFYGYCLRNGGQSWNGGYDFVARAPIDHRGPVNWEKYFDGAWSEPGVGGKSSRLDGGGVAWWLTADETIGVAWVKGGMGLTVSKDRLHFTPLLA